MAAPIADKIGQGEPKLKSFERPKGQGGVRHIFGFIFGFEYLRYCDIIKPKGSMEDAFAGHWLERVIAESRDAQVIASAIGTSPEFKRIIEEAISAAMNDPSRQPRLIAEGIASRLYRLFNGFMAM